MPCGSTHRPKILRCWVNDLFEFQGLKNIFFDIQFSFEERLKEIEANIVDTSSSDAIVSPNAKVIKTENFKKCGHTSTISEMVPREIVNLNKQKVEEYYSEWNMESFDVNEIKLSRKSSGICSEHYVLRESDGYLSISCKNDIGEYIFKGLTDISVQYLPEEDLVKIQKGIEIVGKDNLNKFLEDFE